jgi:GNAT superfamily N-acetyltransferase
MAIEVEAAPLSAVATLRDAYRREMACQIVHDSWHARGFTRLYLLREDGVVVGYGAVGGAPGDPQDVLKEFYVLPPQRGRALPLFRALAAAGGAGWVEAQTNDVLLALMLYDAAVEVSPGAVLFADGAPSALRAAPGVVFRRAADGEVARAFPDAGAPLGSWVVEAAGEVVAAGGLLFHYNPPYGDLFMDVVPAHRRRGYGSFLVQELKRVCHTMGHLPAARCQPSNVASRRTLERAGMFPCARVLRGRLAP